MRSDRWSDHGNWHYGHWLNGRLSNPTVGELINAILADHGLPAADVDGADGTVHGYIIDEPGSARSALEPLTELFGLGVLETAEGLVFLGDSSAAVPIEITEMVSDGREPVVETVRTPDHQLPDEAVLSFRDPLVEYQAVSVRQTRTGAPGSRQHAIGFPGSLEAGQGTALVGDWLRRVWNERERVAFAVTQPNAEIVPGALVRLPTRDDVWLVTEVEDGLVRKVSARQIVRAAPSVWQSANPGAIASTTPLIVGQPLALFLDLPMGAGPGAAEDQFRIAAWQKPWKSQAVLGSPEDTGFAQRTTVGQPADLGVLTEALPPGVCGRVDHSVTITVELYGGELSSISRALLLNGANAVAIHAASGAWEIVQFEAAEEIAPDVWRLGGLLRGQLGTDDATAAGVDAGAHLVVLDDVVQAAGLLASEAGLLLNWRVGPAGSDLSGANFSDHSETGGLRALLPLSPVHLRAMTDGSDVTLSWTRRGRVDADNWTASDIPLGEERVEYQVEIAHAGGAVVRTATTLAQSFLYDGADIAADFGAPPDEIDVTVRQLSLAAGWGLPATRCLSLS